MSYRYLGNKTRIADWITQIVAEILPKGQTIGDLMCGTASMSAAFAAAGYRVIAADTLKFPVLHARARLLSGLTNGFANIGLDYDTAIARLNACVPTNGIFLKEYSDAGAPSNGSKPRRYFTGANAGKIDAIRAKIREWRLQGIGNEAADLLLHDLILASNRVANIAGTYGYYRSTFNNSSRAPLFLTAGSIRIGAQIHEVRHGAAASLIGSIEADAIYLDPPYTKRQYGGNYHILETIAQDDDPEPIGEGGLRDWKQQASDFCYKRRSGKAFRAILDKCSSRWLFISYSEDAHLSEAELTKLLSDYGRVELHECALDRFRSNGRVARQGSVSEHLYVVEMRNAVPAESRGSLVKSGYTQRAL